MLTESAKLDTTLGKKYDKAFIEATMNKIS